LTGIDKTRSLQIFPVFVFPEFGDMCNSQIIGKSDKTMSEIIEDLKSAKVGNRRVHMANE